MYFSELGIPFPLFEAEVHEASEYVGSRKCSICERQGHGFRLGIGCALMIKCPKCGLENGLDANDCETTPCRGCKCDIRFPQSLVDEEIIACFDCLRVGKAAICKDTELGAVFWEQAFDGLTHGIPGMSRADFELVESEDGWVSARLPQQVLFELLRTPKYMSIQGEVWLFCCQRPMIYLGNWSRVRFSQEAKNGDGKSLMEQIIEDVVPGLWEDELHDTTGIYVFRCPTCGKRRGTWDIA